MFLLFAFGGLFIYSVILGTGGAGSLIAGLMIWYFGIEMTGNAYMRIHYLDGELVFLKPLRKFSLFFRKKNRCLRIHPNEWTEVYRHGFKGGTAYYFRNGRTAAYFVKADGLNNFYGDLDTLFPTRVKKTDDFPMDIRRRLRKEDPGRVI